MGGKTGTAQIAVNGRYTDRNGGRHYLATIVGYFPEDNPKYSCLVAIKTYNAPGHRRFYYGASLSGPVFRAIADRVYAKNTAWQRPLSERMEKSEEKPDLKAGRADEMREIAYRFDLHNNTFRGGDRWYDIQAVDSTGIVYSEYDRTKDEVPSVIGMGLKEAIYLLESKGLTVAFSGRGWVESQSIPAGAKITRGATIVLRLGCAPIDRIRSLHHTE